jgi:DNA repair protein SbcC/Rad50
MIPVSLYMKNFLSYGEAVPPLDFTEFDIACLSGSNGHGKSAVLDAMTWALWGEARKAAGEKSAADGLLRIGTTEMQVELEFDLEGDRYRVLRKYQKKRRKRGTASLEFQVFDEAANAYKTLTEKTTRATQERINQALRMKYETFINSAFILQGRVDEFTQKSANKRKEILAEILDLSRYDQLRDLAKEKYKNAEKDKAVLAKQLDTIEAELAHKDEYAAKLTQLQAALQQTDATLQARETTRQDQEQQRAELRSKQQQLTERRQQRTNLTGEVKQLDGKMTRQRQRISDVQAVLDRKDQILAQYRQYEDYQAQNAAYDEKLSRHSALQTQKNTLEQAIQQARHELEKQLGQAQAEQAHVQTVLKDTGRLLQQAQEIEAGFRKLQTCRAEDERLEELRNTVDALDASLRMLEQEIGQQKSQLELRVQAIERQIADLRKTAAEQEAHAKQVAQQQAAVAELDDLEQQREANKEAGAACKAEGEQLERQRARLQQEQQELAQKADILQHSDAPQCPLCKSALDAHKKSEIEQHFAEERTRLQHEAVRTEQALHEQTRRLRDLRAEYKRISGRLKKLAASREDLLKAQHALQRSQEAQTQITALQADADALRRQLTDKAYAPDEQRELAELQQQKRALGYDPAAHKTLKQKIKTLGKFEGQYSKLEDTRQRQQQALDTLPALERKIAELQTALQQRDYAPDEQARLHELESQIAALGYDGQEHDRTRRALRAVQDAPVQKEQLTQAEKTITSLRDELAELAAQREQKSGRIADLDEQISGLERDLTSLPEIERAVQTLTQELHDLRQQRDRLIQERGTYQSKFEHCERLATEAAQLRTEQKQVAKDQEMYGHLMKIFGKDGLQAYLIENAIPEIEDEANAILSRLTDGRTYIAIESVRDLQSGGTKETLDIKISDELGTRSYELYSGGEAFRVDFAIRIALSKLLANRAGTKLKTLVIDEGFGTQDARGLDQLVEAIKTIRTDFEKIVVITHLEALKDAFPVRIEVVKLPDIGSQYQIVH